MTNMFWLIWFALSSFIFIIYGWSLKILSDQKKAWKAFATKYKMQFDAGKITKPPSLTGNYKGYRIYMYTDSEFTMDIRGQRFVSVIEIELGQGMPVGGALSTPNLSPFVLSLSAFSQEYKPKSSNWSDEFIIRTQNVALMKRYLNEQRLTVIKSLFSIKNCELLFIFDEVEAVLRVHAGDPLRTANKIESVLNNLVRQMEGLKISKQEIKTIWDELGTLDKINAPDQEDLSAQVDSSVSEA